MEKLYLLVGLGNPGEEYENTRHNIGFRIVKTFAAKYGQVFKSAHVRTRGSLAKGVILEKNLLLLMPLTFMNESGLAVRKCMDYYKVPLSHLLIICDDVALPFGMLRFRASGSSGGHNGLKSIATHLQTENYSRLRVGVGRNTQRDLADFVLDTFTEEEERKIPDMVDQAILGIEKWLRVGMEKAMQEINPRLGEK